MFGRKHSTWKNIYSENFTTNFCYDISETKFKTRYLNHEKSFNQEKHKQDTYLSNELSAKY